VSTTVPKIGMDRFIDVEWMELAASVARGEMAIDGLTQRLETTLKSVEVRKKTIGILNRMWFPKDPSSHEVAELAAQLAVNGTGSKAAAFEAVAIAAYPYYRQVLEHVGRLTRLQGSCSAGEVHRRMFELHGKRSTIDQATSYAFKTLVSWGLIVRLPDNKIAPAEPVALGPKAKILLDKAANQSRSSITPLDDTDPLLFPFARQ
jgi:hypothetical protein